MKNIIIKFNGTYWQAYKTYLFGLIKLPISHAYSLNSLEDCVEKVKLYVKNKSVVEKVEL